MTSPNLFPNEIIIGGESLAMGVTAESIVTAGGTIPQDTGDIYFIVPDGDDVHWEPNATPTSSFGKKVQEHQVGHLTHTEHGAKIISDDGSDVTLIIIYMKGAGRQDQAYSLANTRHQRVP